MINRHFLSISIYGYHHFQSYRLGITFLALRISQEQRTNGMVKTGSPYGKRSVLIPAVMGTVKQAAIIPDKSAKRLCSGLKTADTAIMVKIAL
jgi:hypothetical protein